MAPTRTPSLAAMPQELLDCVIDHLHDDKASLRACALSHRAWLPQSWRHLHHHVSIDASHPTHKSSRYSFGHSLEYIQSLELIHLGDAAVSPSTMPLLSQLTHVRTLSISFGAWDRLSIADKDSLVSAYPNVETLKINGVSFSSPFDLVDFISSFPHLSHLSVMFVCFSKSESALGLDTCPSPHVVPFGSPIRSLRILECSRGVVDALAMVLGQHPKDYSSKFNLKLEWAISREGSYTTQDTTMEHVFTRLGHLPTKLSLNFRAIPMTGVKGIGHCNHLQSLDISLDLFTIHDGYGHHNHYHWLPELLESVTSRIETISFTCANAQLWRSPVGTATFRCIDGVLTATRFSNLKRVEMYFKGLRESKMQILEYFMTYLPQLVTSGLLMFDVVC